MKRHRIAVVGCGAFARGWHLPNIAAHPCCDLAVTCDTDLQAARECAEQFGAGRFCGDWREVVDDAGVDVIVLAAHTNLRSALIVPALRAGKAMYVEKPLASSDAEMVEIVRASRQTGIPVCVGHNRRSGAAMLELKRLLDKAIAGPGGWSPSVDRTEGGRRPAILEESHIHLLMRVIDDCRSWKEWIFTDPEGILFAEMVHFIDVALWLNPSPPVRVFAEGSDRGGFTLIIRFEDGSLTTILETPAGHFDYPKELIEASTRHVTIAVDHHVEIRQRGLADEPFRRTWPLPKTRQSVEQEGIEGYHRAVTLAFEEAQRTGGIAEFISPDKGHAAHLDRFLSCVEGRGDNPCDAADAVIVTRIALKMLESIRGGTPLAITAEELNVVTD